MPSLADKSIEYAARQTEKFRSARDFVNFFSSDKFRTKDIFTAVQPGTAGWIFRGQRNANHSLCPNAFRVPEPDWRRFTTQVPSKIATATGTPEELAWHLNAELRAVYLFLRTADTLGLQTPIDHSTVSEGYSEINQLFSGKSALPESFPPKSFSRAVALAQHHGIPTRYLDWTESPLIAALFAAMGCLNMDKKSRPDLGVFFLFTRTFKDLESSLEIVEAPKHENSFLRSQQGVFTSLPSANKFYLDNARWPSIEDVLANSNKRVGIATLAGEHAEDLLRILYDLGLTPVHLMPTLDNVAVSFDYARQLYGKA